MDEQLNQATKLADKGDLDGALAVLDQILNPARDIPADIAARAYELQGRCELGVLRNVQAMLSFQEAEAHYHQAGLPEAEAYCRLMQVRKLLDDRLLRDARKQLTESLRDALANNWNDVYRLGLEFLGLLCFHTKELRKAAGLLNEALVGGDRRKLGWEPLMIKLSLSNCHLALGDNVTANLLLNEIISEPRYKLIPRISTYALMNLGYDAYLTGQIDLARRRFKEVIDLVNDTKRQPKALAWLRGMASYNLGQLEVEDGNYDEAVIILDDVAKFTGNHGHTQLLTGCLTTLCVAELLLSRPAKAMRHAMACQKHVNTFGDIETRLGDYFLAMVFLAVGQLENAQLLWLYKPVLEQNAETDMQYGWMLRTLQHLLEHGAEKPFAMDAQALALAERWLKEIEAYDSET